MLARGAGTLATVHHRTEGEMRAEVPDGAWGFVPLLDYFQCNTVKK